MTRMLAILVVVGLCAAACANGDDGRTVRVSAASSLTDVFAALAEAFVAANPGVEVELNLAGSSALREQILEGAPADVFASANAANIAPLVEAGEISGEPEVFARNQLVIAVPVGNPGNIDDLADLAGPDLLVGLCATGVPCGDLARAVLTRAGVEAAVDTDEPNVRALAAKVADAELDVGLVYATDVVDGGELTAVRIAKEDNIVVDYPIATLAGAANQADAESFVAFVLSPPGRLILAEHGFGTP